MKRSTILLSGVIVAVLLVSVALLLTGPGKATYSPSHSCLTLYHLCPKSTATPSITPDKYGYVCVVAFGPIHPGPQGPGDVPSGTTADGHPTYVQVLDSFRVPASQLDANGHWGDQYVQAPDADCNVLQEGIGG